MSPANTVRSRTLFTAAAALVLGLHAAPWPSVLPAQEVAPAELIFQKEPQSIQLVSKRVQQRVKKSNNATPAENSPGLVQPPGLMQQPSQLQQLQQQPTSAQNPKTEVQLELEKLYKENGLEQPEMIDLRNPQPINQPGQTGTAAQGQSTPQGQVQGQLQAPQQFSPQGQPHQAGTAPKKKGVFSKWFGKDDASATSPAETPYIPPTARTSTTAAPMGNQSIPPVAGVVNYGQVYQGTGTPKPSAAPQSQQYSQQPQPQFGGVAPQQPAVTAAPVNAGLDAPVYGETPSTAATSNVAATNGFQRAFGSTHTGRRRLGPVCTTFDRSSDCSAGRPVQ